MGALILGGHPQVLIAIVKPYRMLLVLAAQEMLSHTRHHAVLKFRGSSGTPPECAAAAGAAMSEPAGPAPDCLHVLSS